MSHYKENIEQALQASNHLYDAVKDKRWDQIESLASIRDKASDIAFPDDLPKEYYEEARRVFRLIQNQQEEILALSQTEIAQQRTATANGKRNKKMVQSYLG